MTSLSLLAGRIVALLLDAIGGSVVCGCDISRSNSLVSTVSAGNTNIDKII